MSDLNFYEQLIHKLPLIETQKYRTRVCERDFFQEIISRIQYIDQKLDALMLKVSTLEQRVDSIIEAREQENSTYQNILDEFNENKRKKL